ncbi:MAG: sulfatase [Planctomycetaceae bacterium]|nr:sulfatase [Planctomycetaceae bacterium]
MTTKQGIYHSNPASLTGISRRELLSRSGTGLGMLGFAGLLSDDSLLGSLKAAGSNSPLAPKQPHFQGKAKHVIHIFCNGGPSHVDTFDNKPELTKYHGKPLPFSNLRTERKTGHCFGSPFSFKPYGESGIEVSELYAKTAAAHIDDMCIVRSMHANVPNHEPSLLLMNCGESTLIRPSVGSWVSYGLGTENQNLPAFIAMCPQGYPIKGAQNWQSAFLPGIYQGTYINSQHQNVEKLIANIKNKDIPLQQQRRQLDALKQLNEIHKAGRGEAPELDARIENYELAYRMQLEARDVFDIRDEPAHIVESYGKSNPARQMLIARRLVERGVRYVQLWHGAGQPWDNHDDIEKNHRRLAGEQDSAIAALISDLKRLGLFEETLIVWGGEFGRTPVVELPTAGANAGKINGRDHNHWGFTVWLAGGGIKGGQTYGTTDPFGFKAEENPVHVHDLHATMLHLLGFDHKQLTYRYAGRDYRLTDVHGEVKHAWIA